MYQTICKNLAIKIHDIQNACFKCLKGTKLYRISLKVHHNGLTTTVYGELEYNKKSREQGMQMSCYYPI